MDHIAMTSQPAHPYYPLEAKIVGYLANEYSVPFLLAIFAGGCALIFAATLGLINSKQPHLPWSEKSTVFWFVLCGCIHLFFEGYFALNHVGMASKRHLFGQMWKEYAHSDSRYLTSDPFVLCMESVTAVCWGPLSFLVAWLIMSSHPLRYPLQAVVSLGQLYGDVLYYATSLFDHYHKGLIYSRPEAYYYWGYFFLLNLFWIVIPGALLYKSIVATSRAFRAQDKMSAILQGNGAVKKAI